MKLSYEEKIEIYNEWKVNHKSLRRIAKERNLAYSSIEYMVSLADLHGPEILEHAVFSVFSSLHTLNNNDLGTKETASMESELNHDLESLYRKEELTDVYDAANQQKQDHFIHDLFE